MPFGISRGGAGAVISRGAARALTTAAVAPPLDHPPVGAHLDLQLLAVLTAVRAILVAAGRAAAPLRVNVVCFDLHRQVSMLAPAMACCPALLTAAPRRRRGCLSAGAPGSLLAAAPPRPPFPQPQPQFLQLRSRRLQFAFQPLLSLYRLAMHSAVIARLPALL